jgi:hypothetical protein
LLTTTGAYENAPAAVFAVGKFAASPRAKTFSYTLCLKVFGLTLINVFGAARGAQNDGAV